MFCILKVFKKYIFILFFISDRDRGVGRRLLEIHLQYSLSTKKMWLLGWFMGNVLFVTEAS
jgi:hypothetical protein